MLNSSLRSFRRVEMWWSQKHLKRDNLLVSVIQSILVKNNQVYFVVLRYEAKRNTLGYFVTTNERIQESFFLKASHLVDYKPLILHGSHNKFNFAQ